MSFTWPDLLSGLVAGRDLPAKATEWAMGEILAGAASTVQIAGFAVALRAKGETVEEMVGLAQAMLAAATPITLPRDTLDVVGSGGDRANTVNISTMSAIVAAAAGAPVVKHGNRAASSKCGTADVLEQLGVVLDVPAERQCELLRATGITFLFAPHYHPALRHAAAPRRELAIQTTFNYLGPLANPAQPLANAVGVADLKMAPLLAGVLARRGARGLVFHGADGLDELTTTDSSQVWLIAKGETAQHTLDPRELGLPAVSEDELVGGDPQFNAAVVGDIMAGKSGPVRDIVLLNAAAGILAYIGPNLDQPLAEQLAPRLEQAAEVVDSGKAAQTLARWAELSQQAR